MNTTQISQTGVHSQNTLTAVIKPEPSRGLIEFALEMPQAVAVHLAGTFNNWSPKRSPLKKDRYGRWHTRLNLASGRHEYRFIVDGKWLSDPQARASVQNPFGSTNSVVVVP